MIAIPLIGIALRVLISFFVALGMREIWAAIVKAVGYVIHKPRAFFQKLFDYTVIGILYHSAAAPFVHRGQDDIGVEAKAREPASSGFFGAVASMLAYHTFTVKYLTGATVDGFEAVRRHTVPQAVKVGTRPAREQSEAASRRSRVATKAGAAAAGAAIAARRAADRAANRSKLADHTAKAAAGAIAVPRPLPIPDVWRKETDRGINRWISKHLGRLATLVGAAVGAGVIVRVLVKHLPWYQCSNVKKLANHACGMNRGLLENLLASTVYVGGFISILALAKELQDITDVETRAIRFVIREARKVDLPV